MADNTKYDLKTIKLKPETYDKLIQAKARVEFSKKELHSFDALINHLIDFYHEKQPMSFNDPYVVRKFKNFLDSHP